jgi:hypothetical protein
MVVALELRQYPARLLELLILVVVAVVVLLLLPALEV